MKTFVLKLIILFSIVFLFGSCNDPIFFIVHEEIPVLKPLIDGSPTNFVEYDSKLYVASGKKIFSYSNNKWTVWKKLDGFVIGLAATDSSLYALYLYNNNNGIIKRFYNNGNSSEDLELSNVQSIHASEDVLFISVRNNDTYSIYYKEGSSDIKPISGTTFVSMLNGAVSDSTYYYLCTYSGIFYVDKSQINTSSDLPIFGKDIGFTGIIKLNDNYSAAISNDGKLYEINNASISEAAKFSEDRYSTGALAVWYSGATPSLLLVGRREYYYSTTSGYSNGYVEIALDATGGIQPGAGFNEPGKSSPSSIDNYDRYISSLGKKPINHIIQAPAAIDPNMTLFASTQQNGVWSYRFRDNGMQWNAEQ